MNESRLAIERARLHLRNAAREGLEASRALIDAALITTGGRPAGESGGIVDEVLAGLDLWIATLDGDAPFRMPEAVSEPLRDALQKEIDRWEERSAHDESARPVLRAFLGLRELLWELGMRGPAGPPAEAAARPSEGSAQASSPSGRRARVQHFDLED